MLDSMASEQPIPLQKVESIKSSSVGGFDIEEFTTTMAQAAQDITPFKVTEKNSS